MTHCIYRQGQAKGGDLRRFLRLPRVLVLLGVASAAVVLGSQHRNDVGSWLPFALVLLCPMMHFFHGGQGQHGQGI
ncbi:DUF2933 domain-containing protein [Cupriavidus sp. 8B]